MARSRFARNTFRKHLRIRPVRPRVMTVYSDDNAETIMRRAIRTTLLIGTPRLLMKCETPELGECELRIIRFGESALVGISWCGITESCCVTLCVRGESMLQDELAISAFHDMLEQSAGTSAAACEGQEVLETFRQYGRPAVLHFQMSANGEHSPIPRQISEWIASEFQRFSEKAN